MFGTRTIHHRRTNLKPYSAIAIVAVLFTGFAWQQPAFAQPAGDPLAISLRVYDTSETFIPYPGEICFRIETGGVLGALDSCVYSTTTTRLEWTGFSAPPPGFVWSTAPTIVSDATGCGATIGYESGPAEVPGTGNYVVGFGIRTSCPESPPPPPPPTGVGERMTITIATVDDSGAEFDLPGEICVSLNPGTSAALETCVYRMAVTAIEISGFRVPAAGHDWVTSATITSDTTGCGGRVSYLSGPTLIDGDYNVRYLVGTSCPSITMSTIR